MERRQKQNPPQQRRGSVTIREVEDDDSDEGEEGPIQRALEKKSSSSLSTGSSDESDDEDDGDDEEEGGARGTAISTGVQVRQSATVDNFNKKGEGGRLMSASSPQLQHRQAVVISNRSVVGGEGAEPSAVEGITAVRKLKRRRGSKKRDDDESSVDKEEHYAYFTPRRGSRRRSSQENEERWNYLRKKVRKSLEKPKKPLLGFDKNNFHQQTVPIIWQPIWNCRSVGRLLLVLSILTLPLAVYLFYVQTWAQEYRFTYRDECKNPRNYLRLIRSMCVFCGGGLNPHCSKLIHIPTNMKTPVFLYYELVGFHQNHRKFAKSVDHDQLLGNIFTKDGKPVDPHENCGNFSKDANGKIYFPCGMMANFMYSDDFSLTTSSNELVPLRTHDISMEVLKRFRFKNPDGVTPQNYNYKKPFRDLFVKPRDWSAEMYDNWWRGGGMENEKFINWMNPSSLAHLRKLYAVIDHVPSCKPGVLCKGNYTVNIEYRFDVERYGGDKAFVLATTTGFGGQNYMLPILIGTIGCVQLALGLLLLQIDCIVKAMHRRRHRRSSIRRVSSDEDVSRDHTSLNIDVGSPQPKPLPTSPVGGSKSVSIVTRIPITQESDMGMIPSRSRRKPPPEGVNSESVDILFLNHISPNQSREVLPDDMNDTDDSYPTVYFDSTTTDEKEDEEEENSEGSSRSSSVNSVASAMVSAIEGSSPDDELGEYLQE